MKHPTPQTPEEMQRDVLDSIIRTCNDITVSAYAMDVPGVNLHCDFLKHLVVRLNLIRNTVQQKPIKL